MNIVRHALIDLTFFGSLPIGSSQSMSLPWRMNMKQTTLTRSEAIEYLLDEYPNSAEYEEGMQEHHNTILDEYLDSDDFKEEMAEAQAEILAAYEASDEYEDEMAQARDELISEFRSDLEGLSDDALADEVGVVIEAEDEE